MRNITILHWIVDPSIIIRAVAEDVEGWSQKMKILALGPNSTKFCIHNK